MKYLPIALLCLLCSASAHGEGKAALPRLIDLGAKKCIPCKQMVPVLGALTTEYAGRLEVVFIDVWENRAASKEYGIRLIPTQIFYDAAGREIFRHEGYWSKEAILAKFKEQGIELGRAQKPDDGDPKA